MSHELIPRRQPLHGEVVFDDAPQPRPGDPVALLDLVSFLMDRMFVLPGTQVRFGLNAFLLLLPVLGDLIPALVSAGIVMIGLSCYRVPRIVALRMILNSLLDVSIGWIPVVGDLFDVWFKADTRNVRLLQQYAGWSGEAPPPTWRHWVFVVAVLAVFALVLGSLGYGAVLLVQWLLAPR
jgi:hypothetical protein